MAFGLVDLSGLTVEDLILHRGSGPTDDGLVVCKTNENPWHADPNFCAQPYMQNRKITYFYITRASIQSVTALASPPLYARVVFSRVEVFVYYEIS